jgi:uncharacterized membrane protein
MDTKTTGIVAYLTWIGLLVAYFAGDKEGAKFHINQSLVLFLASIVVGIVSAIPFIGWIIGGIAGIFVFVCWIIAFVGACRGQEKEAPLIGKVHILK